MALCTKYPKYLEKGGVYGRLTVIGVDESSKVRDGKKRYPSQWKYSCKCSCGKIVNIMKISLCTGSTKSCGCYRIETTTKRVHKTNRTEGDGNITKIFFFNTPNYAIIDTVDYNKIKDFCWREDRKGYCIARTNISCSTLLHRVLLGTSKNKVTDHKNRNPLDNRKANLRECTHRQNACNTKIQKHNISGVTGIYYRGRDNVWVAQIGYNKRNIFLGQFKDKQSAIDARKEAEIKYFGDFAPSVCRGSLCV